MKNETLIYLNITSLSLKIYLLIFQIQLINSKEEQARIQTNLSVEYILET